MCLLVWGGRRGCTGHRTRKTAVGVEEEVKGGRNRGANRTHVIT